MKVLAVDVSGRRIVTCGSVFQGTCQLRRVADISDAVETDSRGNTDYFVAANDARLSTVAFVAPGPGRLDALYVAATYTGVAATAVRQAVPAVSVRTLDGDGAAFRFISPLLGRSRSLPEKKLIRTALNGAHAFAKAADIIIIIIIINRHFKTRN